MKKINNFIAAGLAVFAAAACTKTEKVTEPVQGGAVLTVEALAPQTHQPETKVTLNPTDLIKWYSLDKSYAGLYSPGKGIVKSTSIGSSISEDGQQATFKFSSTKITSFDSDAARILYPCTSESSSSSAKFSFSVPAAEQTLSSKAGSSTSYGSSAVVPMISDAFAVKCSYKEAETYYGDTEWYGVASAQMRILSSIVAFYVYDSEGKYASEKVKSIELRSSSSNISAPLSITLPSDNELPALEGSRQTAKVQFSSSSNYFSLSGVTSKETSAPIYLSIIPAEFSGSVIVKTDKASYVFTFDSPKKFARAEVKDFLLNLSSAKVQRVEPTSIQITSVHRATVTGKTGRMVTLTVKLSDNASGFYAYVGTTQISTAAGMQASQLVEKYTVGQSDDDTFIANEDGTISYKHFMSSNFTFSVLPYDASGTLGVGEYLGNNSWGYAKTYNVTADDGNVEKIEDDIVKFNN